MAFRLDDVDFSRAMTTADGHIVDLDDKPVLHPQYGTEAYRARITFELSPPQHALMLALLARGGFRRTKEIQLNTRSAIDQMGLFGGHRYSTKLEAVNGHGAIMNTLITCVDPDPNNKILPALRRVLSETRAAQYGRLLLTPAESKRGERILPLLPTEIYYDHSQLDQDALESIWRGGPGRATIFPAKRERPMRPAVKQGDFFMAEVDAMEDGHAATEHLWVLKSRVRSRGGEKHKKRIIHGAARGFDPHRSRGRRQGEFFCLGDESTNELRIVAEQFELDYEHSNTGDLSGA